ncbi:MCP four helix bundle domain-containing protein [Bacillus sp. CGMCC 1.16541]|uniref:MCP four helix bundle domain-containing protein n=1 Tax=Bacillus sp. CGMCC 1.16541 TaxID=2185143 RepID=UPI000D72AD14|nr:MCP four helix bundle domain-containing protein [Bacillus sp. CGMCC 1.16541]
MKFVIGRKLFISFFIIAILLISISDLSYYYIKEINRSYSEIVDRRVEILKKAQEMQYYAARQNGALRSVLLSEEHSTELLTQAIMGEETKTFSDVKWYADEIHFLAEKEL